MWGRHQCLIDFPLLIKKSKKKKKKKTKKKKKNKLENLK
jgi:hypothetical protein